MHLLKLIKKKHIEIKIGIISGLLVAIILGIINSIFNIVSKFILYIIPIVVLVILWSALLLICYKRTFLKTYCNQIEEKNKDEIAKQVEKRVNTILRENEPNETILIKKKNFIDIVKMLNPLFSNEAKGYSFYQVLYKLTERKNKMNKDFLSEMVELSNRFFFFQRHCEESFDIKLLCDELTSILKAGEKIIKKVGEQRHIWFKDISSSNEESMYMLIKEYDRFTDKLKSFYAKNTSWAEPKLRPLDYLLLGKKV